MKGADAFLSFLRERRSVRRFRNKPVSKDLLAQLVESATWAPSASNRQDWFFTVITPATVRRDMAEAVRRRWDAIIAANRGTGVIEEVKRYVEHFGDFAHAPAVIVVSARVPDAVQRHLLGDAAAATVGSAASAAMAAQNLMLAAHALGLGSCCMTGGLAAREELQQILRLSKRQEIVCLIAVGWPDETPVPPPRKPVSEIGRFVE